MPSKRATEIAVLHAAPQSGYAYKVALSLHLLGLPYQLRQVDLSLPQAERPQEFRAVARFGEVPVLLIDGQALCQSNAICEYLARRQSALSEGDESQRLQVREWLFWEAERLGLNLAHCCAVQQYGAHPAEVAAWYRQRAEQDLTHLAGVLAQRPYLVGEVLTMADVVCFAWLTFAQSLGLFTQVDPAVTAWQQRIQALPGYREPGQIFQQEAA